VIARGVARVITGTAWFRSESRCRGRGVIGGVRRREGDAKSVASRRGRGPRERRIDKCACGAGCGVKLAWRSARFRR